MSTQAASKPLPGVAPSLVCFRAISDVSWFDAGVRRAIDLLDSGNYQAWRSVTPVSGEWDDLVNEVSGFGPPPTASALEDALWDLAKGSAECVVWYRNDEFTMIPVVEDEEAFARGIVSMVASGNIEPQLRFVRRGA